MNGGFKDLKVYPVKFFLTLKEIFLQENFISRGESIGVYSSD